MLNKDYIIYEPKVTRVLPEISQKAIEKVLAKTVLTTFSSFFHIKQIFIFFQYKCLEINLKQTKQNIIYDSLSWLHSQTAIEEILAKIGFSRDLN